MTEALIAPDGPERPNLEALNATITAWEAANDRKLPAAYKTFLTTYNGGRIYPSLFEVRQPPEVWFFSDSATYPLYDWDYAISLWNGKTYYEATPPDMFFIGCNPGGLEILLSLNGATHGQIFTWWGCNHSWGEDGNTVANLYFQAINFAEFIGQMYETPDWQAMEYWGTPRHRLLAQPLKIG